MNPIIKISKAIIGLFLILIYHIPRLLLQLLLLSYALVFNNQKNLTADPKEHLKRTKKLLKKNQNSLLLYAAIELRFCIERISKEDLFISSISNKARKHYEPAKQIAILREIEPHSAYEHGVYLINKMTKKEINLGLYKPLDQERVNSITGRLGDILHPKEGLPLGIENCNWYQETKFFLWDTYCYLDILLKNRLSFLSDKEFIEQWEVIRKNEKSNKPAAPDRLPGK